MSRKIDENNPSFPDEFADEEGLILSLRSLREAFDHVESDEQDGFEWIGETPAKKSKGKTEPEPFVPKLTIYNGSSDSEDFDDNELEGDEPTGSDFEYEEDDSDLPTVAETENIELSPLSILEAMLFVGDKENRHLTAPRASEFMRNVTPDEITQWVAVLNERYAAMNCPYTILQEDQGLRLTLRDDFESVRTRFYGRIKEARLNQSAIDVLSIVAYRQPITADEVQKIRKQPSSTILSQLVRRDLLSLERDTQEKRRITYYRTTERFLQLFGLESLDELPITEEME
ncbi:MAG: SMC-Scp complex subunit ScpB [Planctomycetaceae bacterium]|nr:SMC-Scp complex subunit ScpB [Planctomycetaceae bacterium]